MTATTYNERRGVYRHSLSEIAEFYRAACEAVSEPEKLRQFFEEHYDPHAHFRDPLFESVGYESVLKYSDRLCSMADELRVEQWEAIIQDNRLALWWELDIKFKFSPFRIGLAGMSLLTFDESGKCVDHVEYWDILNGLLNMVPVVPRLLKLAPARIREHLVFLR